MAQNIEPTILTPFHYILGKLQRNQFTYLNRRNRYAKKSIKNSLNTISLHDILRKVPLNWISENIHQELSKRLVRHLCVPLFLFCFAFFQWRAQSATPATLLLYSLPPEASRVTDWLTNSGRNTGPSAAVATLFLPTHVH